MNLPPDRQREHQANERTFLAWLRTSVALIAFGFALTRFSLFLQQIEASSSPEQPSPSHGLLSTQNLGLLLVIFGILTIGLSTWRYNQVMRQIEAGNFPPSRFLVWIMAAVVALFGLLSLPLMLRRPRPQEPSRLSLPE
ncbi:YidH family protein [Thermostichus sp. MS-CIW-15]